MNLVKYRKKTREDLEKELEQEYGEMQSVRFDVQVGKEKDYAQVKARRKTIARILTVLKEKVGKSKSSFSQRKKKPKETEESAGRIIKKGKIKKIKEKKLEKNKLKVNEKNAKRKTKKK